jgi:2'-5' RNA ligase
MAYAVELYIDGLDAQPIRRLFELTHSELIRIGASPHVSLAVFDEIAVPRLIDVVRSFAETTHPFNIQISSVGMFPGSGIGNVVFLAPVVTEELIALHKRFHHQLDNSGLECDPLYLPGNWVPHCTITMEEGLTESLETIKTILGQNILGEYQVSELHVVEFRPVVSLASFKLSGVEI